MQEFYPQYANEERLRESEGLFQTVFTQAAAGIAVATTTGRFVRVNPAFEAISGYTDSELRAMDFLAITHPDDRAGNINLVAQLLAGELSCFVIEKRYVRKDKGIVWVRNSVCGIHDEEGLLANLLAVSQNITRQKVAEQALARQLDLTRQAEERLKEADRRKDEFLAMLAHELRSPLAPIRNATQLMRLGGIDSPRLLRACDVVDRQVVEMTRLVDDLLDVARITQGKISLRKESVELQKILANAVEISSPLLESRRQRLIVSLPEERVWLDADPVRLTQVFANLFNNASKFTGSGGEVRALADRKGDDVLVRVQDTGAGIPQDKLAGVFDLFVQLDPSPSGPKGGLGIGLTIVRAIVEMHGGTVEALSPGLGCGSEFIVRLPVSKAAERQLENKANKATSSSGSPLRILVVDDNADAADTLAELLKLKGHDVRSECDGPSALNVAASFRPEFILLDIGLPGMDGYEVARRVRQAPELSKTTLVALTGYGQEKDRQQSRSAGFDHHLVKPVDPEALLALFTSKK